MYDGDVIFQGDLTINGASTNFRSAIQAVDGSGSLIDADKLDNITSGSFLRSDTSDTFTSGTLTINAGTTFDVNSTSVRIADTSIQFDGSSINFNATGNLTVNSSDLIVEKSSGFVGINTTNPSQSLHIVGSGHELYFNDTGTGIDG